MNEPQARPTGLRSMPARAVASVALLVTLFTSAADDAAPPVSPAEVTASLASGVAWIWPDSNCPQPRRLTAGAPPYREAAVLVESLVLRGQGVERGGRRQPLALPKGARLVPVVHVESATDAPVAFTRTQRDAVIAAVRRHAGTAANAGLLQLDFEAPPRQRAAYIALVAHVREALPAKVRLSVTALAHWCTQGDWLDRLPADEVVPMLYRLGPHADDWRRRFERGDTGLARGCRGHALGFATNDPPSPALLARATRAYWFDEAAWSNPSRPPSYLIP
ncbi:MAG: hypothetical protein EOP39_07535 [Rubrivivax sp.]|nr:MAG: hypothetical protein EOP39_07535 [Rubrivivax sp.]